MSEQHEHWTAAYLPALAPGKADPTRTDFDSCESAEEYIFSRMCDSCKEGRQRAMDGFKAEDWFDSDDDSPYPTLWPACACEWEVMTTDEYFECVSAVQVNSTTKLVSPDDDEAALSKFCSLIFANDYLLSPQQRESSMLNIERIADEIKSRPHKSTMI